jgi:hypothetical protein
VDQFKAKLSQTCKDMSVQEIADTLMMSKHAGGIVDPLAVAAYIKTLS